MDLKNYFKNSLNKIKKTKKYWLFPVLTTFLILLVLFVNKDSELNNDAPFIYKMYEEN